MRWTPRSRWRTGGSAPAPRDSDELWRAKTAVVAMVRQGQRMKGRSAAARSRADVLAPAGSSSSSIEAAHGALSRTSVKAPHRKWSPIRMPGRNAASNALA